MSARLIIAIFITVAIIIAPAAAAPRVLVVINENSPDSVKVGSYYAKKRNIPPKLVCRLRCPPIETINETEYLKFRATIRGYLTNNQLKSRIDYIVLTKGVPIRVGVPNGAFSVDSKLTLLWTDISYKYRNPYYNSKSRFSYNEQGFYLVTRLDGYTVADAKRLVDLSLAAKPRKGLFLFEIDQWMDTQPGYRFVNDNQREAIRRLKAKKLTCELATKEFAGRRKGLMGYYTWGSNNAKFDQKAYAGNTYYPGAIAETVVSTSARTFGPVKEGQSVITDLIKAGVTGVKGYMHEPHADAIAQPQILFDRYTSGFNLAESFYSASLYLHWMDIVIGDPLCAPYAASRGKKK